MITKCPDSPRYKIPEVTSHFDCSSLSKWYSESNSKIASTLLNAYLTVYYWIYKRWEEGVGEPSRANGCLLTWKKCTCFSTEITNLFLIPDIIFQMLPRKESEESFHMYNTHETTGKRPVICSGVHDEEGQNRVSRMNCPLGSRRTCLTWFIAVIANITLLLLDNRKAFLNL